MQLKSLLRLYDHSYNHPSALPGDPARKIPSPLRSSLYFYNIGFFGGLFALVISTTILVVFLPLADFYSFRFGKDVTETTAKIIQINSAHYSENDQSYYEYVYEYEIKGIKYKGASFDLFKELTQDSTTRIQYQNTSPSTSRIIGMRMAPAPIFTIPFIAIFIFFSIGIFISSLRAALNKIFLLRHGIVTEALITETIFFRAKDSESADTNDVYIEFVTNKGNQVKTKINIEASKMARPGKNASILYLPWNPSVSVFVKALKHEERAVVERF